MQSYSTLALQDSAVDQYWAATERELDLPSSAATLHAAHAATLHAAGSFPHCGVIFQPIVEVAFPNNMWWSLPAETSKDVWEAHLRGEVALYTCEERSYKIDFETMEQENTENGRRRSIRLLWLQASDVKATYTGQLPGERKRRRTSATSVWAA